MQTKLLKVFTGLVLVLALAFPFLLALDKIHESDSFWHLKTGQWILSHGSVPRTDFYSSTVEGKSWLDWEWLFQAAMGAVYAAGGFSALVIVKAVVAALVALLLLDTSRRNGAGLALSAIAMMLAFVVARDRLEMRPDLAFLLFAAATIAVLEAARRGRTRLLWSLPLLQVVWVNCHASFPLGIALVGMYVAGDVVEGRARPPEAGKPSRDVGNRPLRAAGLQWIVLLLVCVASVVNPYGIELIRHAVAQTSTASPAGVIGEWQPTMQLVLTEPNWSLRVFWWLFWLTPIFLVARMVIERRQFPWTHALVVAGMSVLAMRANRFTAIYAIVTAPILASAVMQIARKIGGRSSHSFLRWAGTTIVGALAGFLIGVVVTNAWAKAENRSARFGLGVDDQVVPLRALDRFNKLPAGLGLFNTFPSGGPLIWESVPPWRVFTDGRANLYGREFVDQYRAALRDPDKWETWMRERDISVVFVQYGTGDDGVLLRHLAQSPAWSLVYFDHAACLFARTGQVTPQVPWSDAKAVVRYGHQVADEVAGENPYTRGRALATMGNFLMVCGKTEAAEQLFVDAVVANPRISEAWMNLGVIERDRGQFDRALECANQLLARNPYYYQGRLLRAEILAQRRDLDGAIAEVDTVLWRVPHSAQAWFKRAQLAAQKGDRDKAIRSLQRVVAEEVEDPTVYWFLAKLLAGQGRRSEALRAYEDCLRVWVGSPEQKLQVEAELKKLRETPLKR